MQKMNAFKRIWTADLDITSVALCQLSYEGLVCSKYKFLVRVYNGTNTVGNLQEAHHTRRHSSCEAAVQHSMAGIVYPT